MLYEDKKQSLFDVLEDTDYDECLARSQAIAGAKASGQDAPSGMRRISYIISCGAYHTSSNAAHIIYHLMRRSRAS